MTSWIIENVFSTLTGWLGVAGVIVVICGVIAWLFPPFRRIALIVAGVAVSFATIYAKGSRDRANLEARRKEEAVQKARKDYEKIDARPDSPDTVGKRMSDGSF